MQTKDKPQINWKTKLNPQQYHILREKGTEHAFTGKYVHNKKNGMYHCAGCGAVLFSSDTKFDSGTGWPSFSDPVTTKNIVLNDDDTHGMHRIEVLCKNCSGHLGHVFDDGSTHSGKRYCINSCALKFEEKS